MIKMIISLLKCLKILIYPYSLLRQKLFRLLWNIKKLDDNNLKVICFTRDAYLDIEYVKYKGSMFL